MLLITSLFQIKGRTLRVDHVANYRPPKDSDDIDDVTKSLRQEGCAPKLSSSSSESEEEDGYVVPLKKSKKGCGSSCDQPTFLKVVLKNSIHCWCCKVKVYTLLSAIINCHIFTHLHFYSREEREEEKEEREKGEEEREKRGREEESKRCRGQKSK